VRSHKHNIRSEAAAQIHASGTLFWSFVQVGIGLIPLGMSSLYGQSWNEIVHRGDVVLVAVVVVGTDIAITIPEYATPTHGPRDRFRWARSVIFEGGTFVLGALVYGKVHTMSLTAAHIFSWVYLALALVLVAETALRRAQRDA
jgi:hypothetical protein